ncbi:hypothetical protein SGPA1_21486 [Streptomyces misionensis JCM 4497]
MDSAARGARRGRAQRAGAVPARVGRLHRLHDRGRPARQPPRAGGVRAADPDLPLPGHRVVPDGRPAARHDPGGRLVRHPHRSRRLVRVGGRRHQRGPRPRGAPRLAARARPERAGGARGAVRLTDTRRAGRPGRFRGARARDNDRHDRRQGRRRQPAGQDRAAAAQRRA